MLDPFGYILVNTLLSTENAILRNLKRKTGFINLFNKMKAVKGVANTFYVKLYIQHTFSDGWNLQSTYLNDPVTSKHHDF